MRPDLVRLVLFWTTAAWLGTACAAHPGDPTVLVLVRHAEKAASGSDPELTPEGMLRAERLAGALRVRDIEAVWSSDYRRTLDTARPLAAELQLEIRIYDPRSQQEFAGQLVAAGRNAFVVGHSNTIPALAALLCRCEVAPIAETEYERLFVITIDGDQARLTEFGQKEFFQQATPR
jgi:broad specificity phosphatase PhoE